MSIAVRRPAGGHAIGHPDVAVVRVDAPVAVRVQVLVAKHVGRDIAGGQRAVQSAVARAGPTIEVVEARRGQILVLAQVGSGEAIRLPRINNKCCAFTVHLTLAFAHDDHRRIAVGIDFDPVFTSLAQRKGEIGCVHLQHLLGRETTHADDQSTLRQLQLRDSVVEIENGQAGIGGHANQGAADLDFRPCPRICPKTIATGQRTIERRLVPIVLAGG